MDKYYNIILTEKSRYTNTCYIIRFIHILRTNKTNFW